VAVPPQAARISSLSVQDSEADAIHAELGDAVTIHFPPRIGGRGGVEGYQAYYDTLVIEFMSLGFSLAAFAGRAGVSKDTLARWGLKHDSFRESVKIAKLACQEWWERQLHEVALKGTHTSGRVSAIQFALKNLAKDDWSDTSKIELSGRDGAPLGGPVLDYSLLTVDEMAQLEFLISKATPSPELLALPAV
jgi:hypothetical protein